MKNRTVIGIVCVALAVLVTLVVSPLVTKLTNDTVSVPRLASEVERGAELTENDLETVDVPRGSLPAGILTDPAEIVGRYAASTLYAGDYLTAKKLTADANTAEAAFGTLDGTRFAMSFAIDDFAAGLSGKLENGDIISVIVVDDETGRASIPAALRYVKVITATTAGGVDKDELVKNDDGSFDIPATVTVLVDDAQAKLLSEYAEDTVRCLLVYRGDAETAGQFLATQDEYLKTAARQTTVQTAEEKEAEANE